MHHVRYLKKRHYTHRSSSSVLCAWLSLLLAFISVSCSGNGSGNDQSTDDDEIAGPGGIERVVDLTPVVAKADSMLQVAVDLETVAGAVLMIGIGGETFHNRAFGYAQRYEYRRIPMSEPADMTTGHLFDLASLTKVFATTFGMMLLVDRNQVDLEAPVFTYLPEFRGVSKDSVTVRHLLTHSGGLYPWKPLYYHADNSRDTYAYISQLELAYPVGEGRHYSDLGFMLLGYLIEEVSGQPLQTFLQESLYEPLGLEATGFLPLTRNLSPIAATSHGNPFERKMVADDDFGYLCDEDADSFTQWRERVLVGEVNDGNAFHANGGVAGHAGLFSTASDLQVLLNLLLNKGVHEGEQYLSEEVVDLFLTRNEYDNGLGWAMSPGVLRIDDIREGTFGHTGFTGTFALAVPESGLTVLLLTNRQNVGVDSTGRYNSVTHLRSRTSELLINAVLNN